MNCNLPIYSLLAFLYAAMSASAQVDSSESSTRVFEFSGRSRLTGVSASPRAESSGLPERYLRWEFEPTASVYGLPISARVLLTTENDPSRHAMNSVEILFDVKAFQQNLRERVMESARSTATDFGARAEEMRARLSDPSVAADLARFDELKRLEEAGELDDTTGDELDELRARTEESRKMAVMAERYADMSPEEMAAEKKRELRRLQREIADPGGLEEKVNELGLLSGTEKFLFGIQEMGIGVTYPRYSSLVLSGVPVNGVSLEYSYGLLTVAGAGGSMDGPIPYGRLAPQTFDRTLFAGKIGLGRSAGTHLHLIGFYAKDNSASATSDSSYVPGKNYIAAMDGQADLFNGSVILSGQAAGSVFTRNTEAPSSELDPSDDPTGLGILNSFDPNFSTSLDLAWMGEASFNLFGGRTRGSIAVKSIGPGYTSLGVPYLRSDMFGQEARLEQRLFGGGVRLGGYYKRNEDNILPWKRIRVGDEWLPVRTTLTSYGGALGLQFRDLPYLRVEYAPYLQQTDIEGEGSGADNRTTMISATGGHSYRVGKLNGSTTAMVLVQTGTSHNELYRFTNNAYMLNQNILFTFPLTITLGGSYTETNLADVLRTITGIQGSGSVQISSILKGSFGLVYSRRNDGGNRIGFTLRSAVQLWGYGEFDLRLQRNAYQSGIITDEDYEQLTLRGVLTTQW